MTIDVEHEINAVQRQVGTRQLPAGQSRTMTIRRTYAAALEDVWDAVTSIERIPRWFLPISGDLRVGGRYQLEGNAGGTIERCDPPNSFAATWEFGGEVSWIELRLTAVAADQTRFELEHTAHVDDERWAEFGPGALGVGWDLGLTGLGRHIATGEKVDPHAAAVWMMSDAGRQFVAETSRAWAEASIAAGTPRPAAEAAAARTTAFYSPAPPAGA
jgi:uncharacterized protein YndB with AHSA1/START domain